MTYTLVGTVDSEHESARIPNIIAFKDLLAGQSINIYTSYNTCCASTIKVFFTCDIWLGAPVVGIQEILAYVEYQHFFMLSLTIEVKIVNALCSVCY